jgi:ribosomal protein S27E
MVTVVSRVPPPSLVKQCLCRNCGATLEYIPRDVQKEIHADYGGGRDTYEFIKCPDCDNKIGV